MNEPMLMVEASLDVSHRGVSDACLPSGVSTDTSSCPPAPGRATASFHGPFCVPHQFLHAKRAKPLSPGCSTRGGACNGAQHEPGSSDGSTSATGSMDPSPATTCTPGCPSSVHAALPLFTTDTAPARLPVAPCQPAIPCKSEALHAGGSRDSGVAEGSAAWVGVSAAVVAWGVGGCGPAVGGLGGRFCRSQPARITSNAARISTLVAGLTANSELLERTGEPRRLTEVTSRAETPPRLVCEKQIQSPGLGGHKHVAAASVTHAAAPGGQISAPWPGDVV